jgi:hypothetical protein
MKPLFQTSAIAIALILPSLASAAEGDWMQRVGEALGKPGTEMPGGIYRVGLPRTDLHVTLDGVAVRPALALGSWLAFEKHGEDAIVMGDLVLTGDEVNPVMRKLAESGIEVTALHNHLLRSEPFTMYMHVMGAGDPTALAGALHQALAASRTPLEAALSGSSALPAPEKLDLDTAAIDAALGHKGKVSGGVYQVSIPRAAPVRENGMEVPPAMGAAIGINFQPTGGGKAATTGDFVLTADEVNPVLRALGEHGIEVTAIHNHMLNDEPRLFFMHFWGNDTVPNLAAGLGAALARVKIAKG